MKYIVTITKNPRTEIEIQIRDTCDTIEQALDYIERNCTRFDKYEVLQYEPEKRYSI